MPPPHARRRAAPCALLLLAAATVFSRAAAAAVAGAARQEVPHTTPPPPLKDELLRRMRMRFAVVPLGELKSQGEQLVGVLQEFAQLAKEGPKNLQGQGQWQLEQPVPPSERQSRGQQGQNFGPSGAGGGEETGGGDEVGVSSPEGVDTSIGVDMSKSIFEMAKMVETVISSFGDNKTCPPGSVYDLTGLQYAGDDDKGAPVFMTPTFLHNGTTCTDAFNTPVRYQMSHDAESFQEAVPEVLQKMQLSRVLQPAALLHLAAALRQQNVEPLNIAQFHLPDGPGNPQAAGQGTPLYTAIRPYESTCAGQASYKIQPGMDFIDSLSVLGEVSQVFNVFGSVSEFPSVPDLKGLAVLSMSSDSLKALATLAGDGLSNGSKISMCAYAEDPKSFEVAVEFLKQIVDAMAKQIQAGNFAVWPVAFSQVNDFEAIPSQQQEQPIEMREKVASQPQEQPREMPSKVAIEPNTQPAAIAKGADSPSPSASSSMSIKQTPRASPSSLITPAPLASPSSAIKSTPSALPASSIKPAPVAPPSPSIKPAPLAPPPPSTKPSPPAPSIKPAPFAPPSPSIKPAPLAPPTPSIKPAPLTPPSSSIKPAPLAPPSPSIKPAPLAPPSPSIKPAPLAPPSSSIKPAPLAPPSSSIKPAPLAPPSSSIKPAPLAPPSSLTKPAPLAPPSPSIQPAPLDRSPPSPSIKPAPLAPPSSSIQPTPLTPPSSSTKPAPLAPPSPSIKPAPSDPPSSSINPTASTMPSPSIEPAMSPSSSPLIEPSLSASPSPSFEPTPSASTSPLPTPSPSATSFPTETPTTSTVAASSYTPTPAKSPSSYNRTAKAACFPGSATVQLENGRFVAMRELRVGDSVRSSATAFTKVLLFTHADDVIETEFVNIHWDLESSPISLSPNHYIHCNGKLVVASAVQVGDTIISGVDGGRSLTVTDVDRKRMVGLYNPQTASGNIVVNGIVASTFTTAVPIKLAQVLLMPLKIASEMFSIDIPDLSRFFRFGAPWAAAVLPYGPASYEL